MGAVNWEQKESEEEWRTPKKRRNPKKKRTSPLKSFGGAQSLKEEKEERFFGESGGVRQHFPWLTSVTLSGFDQQKRCDLLLLIL